MFTNTQATAMLPAKDAARAKSWYADKLGLKPVEDFADNGAAYNLGGTRVSFQTQADAPSCAECGSIMVRNGSCYKCLNCGSTSGCS